MASEQRLIFLFLLLSASIPELLTAKPFIMLYGIKQLLFKYFFSAISGEVQSQAASIGTGRALIWIFILRISNAKSERFQSITRDSIRS